MGGPVTVGVSLKTYFGNAQARDWLTTIADRISVHPAVADGSVSFFVIPTYLQLHDALTAFADTRVLVGAQDVSQFEPGAYTGEVTAQELAEIGVTLAEIGHAERRRLFGDIPEVVAAKTATALAQGITPVLCIGETDESSDVAGTAISQLRDALYGAPAGPVVVAYEPVWAIGAPEPAPVAHITTVTTALRAEIDTLPDRVGSVVIYGGSAGPGLLTHLGTTVDGLFLGRFAHNPDNLHAVVDEASALADRKAVTSAASR